MDSVCEVSNMIVTQMMRDYKVIVYIWSSMIGYNVRDRPLRSRPGMRKASRSGVMRRVDSHNIDVKSISHACIEGETPIQQ